jgi:hypothetical protein
MTRIFVAIAALAAVVGFAAAQPGKKPYQPGLGEFMTATQLRHAKLWFAGSQNNWDLAAYEIDELKEGFEDAASLHPIFEGIPVAEMIKSIISPQIQNVERAVKAKSAAKFAAAFDQLTDGCNSCHAGANKPFIRIQRPNLPPITNQDFAPSK